MTDVAVLIFTIKETRTLAIWSNSRISVQKIYGVVPSCIDVGRGCAGQVSDACSMVPFHRLWAAAGGTGPGLGMAASLLGVHMEHKSEGAHVHEGK